MRDQLSVKTCLSIAGPRVSRLSNSREQYHGGYV